MHVLGCLHQAEKSASLQQCHNSHPALRLLHGHHLPDLPIGWPLTLRPAPLALCSAPREQAEGREQAEAHPHCCCESSLPCSKDGGGEG